MNSFPRGSFFIPAGAWAFCNFLAAPWARYSVPSRPQSSQTSQMTNPFTHGFSWIALHWTSGAVIAGAIGIAATCRRCLETDKVRAQRADRNRKRELRGLADKISTYGRNVHRRYPTGDVVVSEHDLAEQLRKPPDAVAKALNMLLGEQRVQKAPLSGYWKLRSRPAPEDSQRETFA
jgi:hypothetical protein